MAIRNGSVLIQLVRDKSAERGLLLNVKKTKILVVDSNREDTTAFNPNCTERGGGGASNVHVIGMMSPTNLLGLKK